MSQRTLLLGILSLALMSGFAIVAEAQSERGMRQGHDHAPGQNHKAQGAPLTDVYFMVLDLRADERVGDLRPGETWTMEAGETLRFRTAGRAGGGPERYPATRFRVVRRDEHVKIEGANREVGNVTVTATQPAHERGERTEIHYEIVDQGMDAQPRLRSGSFFIAVAARHGDSHAGGGTGQGVAEAMVLHEHQDFRGDREVFAEGEVRDLRSTRFPADAASSIQLAQGCRVVLYEHPDHQGRSAVLTQDEADLRRVEMNDNLSSFVLECFGNDRPGRPGTVQPTRPDRNPGKVTIFEHQNFRGRSEAFFEGEIANMTDTRLGADVASSVRIEGNCRIALFEHPGFEGQSTILSRDESDLGRHRMNDNLSSFRIECGRGRF